MAILATAAVALFASGALAQQAQSPAPQAQPQTNCVPMGPGQHMSGMGYGQHMNGPQGQSMPMNGYMNGQDWQQMRSEMAALREEMAQLRTELKARR